MKVTLTHEGEAQSYAFNEKYIDLSLTDGKWHQGDLVTFGGHRVEIYITGRKTQDSGGTIDYTAPLMVEYFSLRGEGLLASHESIIEPDGYSDLFRQSIANGSQEDGK